MCRKCDDNWFGFYSLYAGLGQKPGNDWKPRNSYTGSCQCGHGSKNSARKALKQATQSATDCCCNIYGTTSDVGDITDRVPSLLTNFMESQEFEKLRNAALRNAMISTFLLAWALVITLRNPDYRFVTTIAALSHVLLVISLGLGKQKGIKLTAAQNRDPKLLIAVFAPAIFYLIMNAILFLR